MLATVPWNLFLETFLNTIMKSFFDPKGIPLKKKKKDMVLLHSSQRRLSKHAVLFMSSHFFLLECTARQVTSENFASCWPHHWGYSPSPISHGTQKTQGKLKLEIGSHVRVSMQCSHYKSSWDHHPERGMATSKVKLSQECQLNPSLCVCSSWRATDTYSIPSEIVRRTTRVMENDVIVLLHQSVWGCFVM